MERGRRKDGGALIQTKPPLISTACMQSARECGQRMESLKECGGRKEGMKAVKIAAQM